MTYIILKEDKTIKTYLDRIDDVLLEEGETFKRVEDTFEAYSERFVVSHNGVRCLTVNSVIGADPVLIDISAPGYSEVAVTVSGAAQVIPLVEGKGSFSLPTDVPGRYCVEPADKTLFCAAGYGSLLVIVE